MVCYMSEQYIVYEHIQFVCSTGDDLKKYLPLIASIFYGFFKLYEAQDMIKNRKQIL